MIHLFVTVIDYFYGISLRVLELLEQDDQMQSQVDEIHPSLPAELIMPKFLLAQQSVAATIKSTK